MLYNVGEHDPLAKNLSVASIKQFGIDLIVVSLADHPTPVLHCEWYQSLDQTETPYLILTSYQDADPRTLYCPTWMILFPNLIHGKNPTLEQAAKSDRPYKFSCLNNKFKIERILLLIEMYRNPDLFTNSVITMNSLVTEWHPEGCSQAHITQLHFLLDDKVKSEYLSILHEKIIPALPLTHPGTAMTNGDFFSCDNAAYTDSRVNIVTEYGSSTAFVSEKSLKPILAGQFFVNSGSPGTVQLLRDAGFDTYDDIIDHNQFEHDRVFSRVENLIKYLRVIQNYEWSELYNKTTKRRLANRDFLISGQIETTFFNRLNNKINELLR